MDFGREGFYSEEEKMGHRGGDKELPFSYSSQSSSSSQYKTQQPSIPLTNSPQIHQMSNSSSSNWLLGNKYEYPEEDEENHNSRSCSEATGKLDLMDVSTENESSDSLQEICRTTSAVAPVSASTASNSSTVVSILIEKEHMFDKVVTPSDVGKLNRLVIPKQHAEKYFPLDSSSNEKGLLLNFEDRSGKPWRFRYSYWNSSQSYVMTKGWSRFVKEKKLDAGDIVSFQRGIGELGRDRLYIDWRRRAPPPDHRAMLDHFPHHSTHIPWSPLLLRPAVQYPTTAAAHHHLQHLSSSSQSHTINNINNPYGGYSYGYSGNVHASPVFYLRSAIVPQVQQHREQVVFDSVPVVHGKAAAKRLRLFGVNMDCPISESDLLSSSSSATGNITATSHAAQLSSSSSPQNSLQLRLFNGTPLPDFLHKDKSLDLDM